MKNATAFVKKFKTFRRKLTPIVVIASDHGVIGEVIYSHLIWNASTKQADVAYKRLVKATLDMNDLRVNMIDETIELIGENYPEARERAKRLHAVLNAIYNREHDIQIKSLEGAGKRDIREYFETLNGITTFVCNRIISVCYGVAAMPVDERTLDALVDHDIIHEESEITTVATWLTRQVKADEIVEFHGSLQAWVEVQPRKEKSVAKKQPKKKATPKKAAPKKAAPKKEAKKETPKKKAVVKKVAKKAAAKKKVTKKKVAKKASKKATKKVAKKPAKKATKKTASKKKVTKKTKK